MGAHHAGAQLAGEQCLSRGGHIAVVKLFHMVGLAHEALARDRHHDRIAQVDDLVEIAHELDGLLGRLAEARARIDADAGAVDAGRLQSGGRIAQVIAHFGHHVLVNGVVLHGSGLALHVHDHAAAAAAAHRLAHGGIAKTRHVVDDGSAGMQGADGHLGMARIHRHADAGLHQGRHDLADAIPLLIGRDRRGARTRRLAAHIHNGGTGAHHFQTVGHSCLRIEISAAVGGGIGGHVQNAHDDGRAGVEVVLSAMPNHEC